MQFAPQARLRWLAALLLLVSCIGCDQATKGLATRQLQNAPGQSYLAGTIQISYALNPGGFLSLGGELPESIRQRLFVGLNVCMMVGLSLLLLRSSLPMICFLALVLILAGGIGNLIDRLSNGGYVTDFICLGIGPIRTGIFNVADVAITLGCLLIACHALRSSPSRDQPVPQQDG